MLSVSNTNPDRQEAIMPAVLIPTEAITTGHEPFVGVEGITLQVSQRSWKRGADEAAIIAGLLCPDSAIATQDCRRADLSAWHEGPVTDEVFYERYELVDGLVIRRSHGWIDSVSRKLVQAG